MRKLLIEKVEDLSPETYNRLLSWTSNGTFKNEAGTDHPCYLDVKSGVLISGDYEDEDARPFAYFPIETNGKLKFFIKEYDYYDDEIITHGDLFGDAFDEYMYNYLWENFAGKERPFVEKVAEFGEIVKKENLSYSCYDNSYSNEETGEKINFRDFLANLFSELSIPIEANSKTAYFLADFFTQKLWSPDIDFINDVVDFYHDVKFFRDQDDQEYFGAVFGVDVNKLYNKSRFEGRIWDEGRLITFYPGQLPGRNELPGILKDICKDGSHTLEELGDFYIIFEFGSKMQYTGSGYKSHDDATVKCCLIRDYLAGNFEGYSEEAEADMVSNRKGITNFCAHLANQKDKFNYFKNFRKTRDNAVYAPREKAAGTLAGYHAMRYPYGEEKIVNGNELNESFPYKRDYDEAGTDHPRFKNKKTGEIIEANWDDGDGFPFGYWKVDANGDMEFCVADYGETHAQACGIAAEKYFNDKIDDMTYETADELCTALNDFAEQFKENNYTYDQEEDVYISEDGSDKMTLDDFVDTVYGSVYSEFEGTYSIITEYVEMFINDGIIPSYEEIQQRLIGDIDGNYFFHERDDIDRALEVVGSNFSDFFEEGNSMGRIWPDKKLITFYSTQQPNPEEMEEIIYDLGQYMDEPYEYFMNFRYIYEDWDYDDDDYLIKMCTIDNFINSDIEEPDKQYARDGKTEFVPHLANQRDKFNFFRNFRNTRDKAVYAPRERAAGTLAGYHAMRYPYGENRKSRLLTLVNEEINKMLNEMINESKNSNRAKNQTKALIAQHFGMDVDSPYVDILERNFKTNFFTHGLDNDRFIVFEPGLCRCALEMGFGTNDFTYKDSELIATSLSTIFSVVDSIKDPEQKSAELKRIKDGITSVDSLQNILNDINSTNMNNPENVEQDNQVSNEKFKNGYTVIGPVTDFDTIHKYGNYSNPAGKLCFSQEQSTWKKYLAGGRNTCYILLRDGWENLKPTHDGSCAYPKYSGYSAYDDYGMSMIVIFVDEQGRLVTSNGRWNHGASWPPGMRCDKEFTEDDLSNIIGAPFKNVFKSNFNFDEEVEASLIKLKMGTPFNRVFSFVSKRYFSGYGNIYEVGLCGKRNYLTTDYTYVFDRWFDTIYEPNRLGYGAGIDVYPDGTGKDITILNMNGDMYKFSDYVNMLKERLARGENYDDLINTRPLNNTDIRLANAFGSYNFLYNNKFLSPVWFDRFYSFSPTANIAYVGINTENYILDCNNGKIITVNRAIEILMNCVKRNPEKLNTLLSVGNKYSFDNGVTLTRVRAFDKFNILDNDLNPIFPKWFKSIGSPSKRGIIILVDDDGSKYVGDLKTGGFYTKEEYGEMVRNTMQNGGDMSKFFDRIEDGGEGTHIVYEEGKGYTFIKNGSYLCSMYFKHCDKFQNGFAIVRTLTNMYNYINSEGKVMLEYSADYIMPFKCRYTIVEYNTDEYDDNGENIIEQDIIDGVTGQEIINHDDVSETGQIENNPIGVFYYLDNNDNCIVFTKDNRSISEEEYCRLLSEEWNRTKDMSLFSNAHKYDNFTRVRAIYLYNIITEDGKLLFDEWMYNIYPPSDGRIAVNNQDYFNYLDENLKPILPPNSNIRFGHSFHEGAAVVIMRKENETDNDMGYIDINGNPLFGGKRFKYCTDFKNGKAGVTIMNGSNYEYYILYRDGQMEKKDNK